MQFIKMGQYWLEHRLVYQLGQPLLLIASEPWYETDYEHGMTYEKTYYGVLTYINVMNNTMVFKTIPYPDVVVTNPLLENTTANITIVMRHQNDREFVIDMVQGEIQERFMYLDTQPIDMISTYVVQLKKKQLNSALYQGLHGALIDLTSAFDNASDLVCTVAAITGNLVTLRLVHKNRAYNISMAFNYLNLEHQNDNPEPLPLGQRHVVSTARIDLNPHDVHVIEFHEWDTIHTDVLHLGGLYEI